MELLLDLGRALLRGLAEVLGLAALVVCAIIGATIWLKVCLWAFGLVYASAAAPYVALGTPLILGAGALVARILLDWEDR